MDCTKCHSALNPDWLFCPFCSQSLLGDNEKFSEQKELEKRIENENIPFYEKFSSTLKIHYIPYCLLTGIILFLIHYSLCKRYGADPFKDKSFFLSFMTASILFLLIWATKKLRKFVFYLYSFAIVIYDNNNQSR